MIELRKLSKQYGAKRLFKDLNMKLGPYTRAALVGPNGAGKSTLLRLILNQEEPDSGEIIRAKGWLVGHLAQEVPRFESRLILDEVTRLGGRRDDLWKERRELEDLFSKSSATGEADFQDKMDRYSRILEEQELLDEYRIEARAKEILQGLGFKPGEWSRSLASLSGGWLMRVALAKILIQESDLLLLDEPTNHLDLESMLWLENFLRNYHGALLLISHDAAFLNKIVTQVFDLDQSQVFLYSGNVDSYVDQKALRMEQLIAAAASQEAKMADLERFIQRFGAKASKASQAQSRQKQLDKMQADKIEIADPSARVRFRFPPSSRGGNEVAQLKSVTLKYQDNTVFKNLDFTLVRGSRLAVVGPNGAGKTTLLRILAGELSPTLGDLRYGHEVRTGYFAQHQADSLDLKKTVYEELETIAPLLPVAQLRGVAGAFLFTGDDVFKRCSVLSGGEKARVALAKLLLSPSNFLILDEPTNHLDADSKAVLKEALEDFKGTLCIVSHDRRFMDGLVDKVLEIVPGSGGSQVHVLIESYSEYLDRKENEIAVEQKKPKLAQSTFSTAPSVSPSGGAGSVQADERTKPSNNKIAAWKKELEKVETEIQAKEKKQSEVADRLSKDDLFGTQDAKLKALLHELLAEQIKLATELNQLFVRWEELSENLSNL